jgi:polyribonucleotide nucleotidyltransferase
MVEGGAREVPEAVVLDALSLAQQEIQKICAGQDQLCAGIAKPKMTWRAAEMPSDLKKAVGAEAREPLQQAVRIAEKSARDRRVAEVHEKVRASLALTPPSTPSKSSRH